MIFPATSYLSTKESQEVQNFVRLVREIEKTEVKVEVSGGKALLMADEHKWPRWLGGMHAAITALREKDKEIERLNGALIKLSEQLLHPGEENVTGARLTALRERARCECGNPSGHADTVDFCCDCGGYKP